MELLLELHNPRQPVPEHLHSRTFKQGGGVIGRGQDCDWVIPDRHRHLSNRHAEITFNRGTFYLTDTSSNGIEMAASGARLRKGEPQRIETGSVYRMGDYELRARVIRPAALRNDHYSADVPGAGIIPDDAFLDLDPINALEQQERIYSEFDELAGFNAKAGQTAQRADYARIDMESLPIPELVPEPVVAVPKPAPVASASESQSEAFWQRFGSALGVDFTGLDESTREAMAIKAANLLKLSIGGLQQSLRTRSELKNELRLAQTTVQTAGKNPLKHTSDAEQALSTLLQAPKPGQFGAEESVVRAFRDVQAHQVAMLAGSRAAVRATLEHFSPEQLTLRFEREGQKPMFAGAGSRWRAFSRHHHALRQDDDWSERLLARDFAQAYEEQIRLIFTLNSEHQG
jgi:type VI secretion system protein ImpI